MHKRMFTLLPVGLVLLAATIAWADVGPPLKVTLMGDPRPAVQGEVFEGVLEIEFMGEVELRDFACDGESWTTVRLSAPASATGAKGDRIEIEFAALPADPDKPLVISFDASGYPFRKTLDLSQRNYQRTQQPPPAFQVPDQPDNKGSRQALAPNLKTQAPVPEKSSGDVKSPIRIHGRFGAPREDGIWVGGDAFRIHVYDEDSTSDDELMGSDWTDGDGYFDFDVDSASAGDVPDIYILVQCFNYRTEVRDPTYDNIYSWSSGTTWNVTGTELNFGTLQPSSEDDHPAVHLHTNNGHNFDFCWYDAGYDPGTVGVIWPDGATGAWFDYTDIHISSDREWQEGTLAHEYGHFWDHTFSGIEPFDYCNGWCDTSPTDCGHCFWCEESGVIAYMEGWAQFFSSTCTGTFLGAYGLAPMYEKETEVLQECGTYGFHDPDLTEGFAACLLSDIEDMTNENEPQYPDWSDVTGLWIEEIFLTADLDNPDGPMDFLDKFNARYPGYSESVWQTAANNGYDPDHANPGLVTSLTSSHSTSGDSPDPTVYYAWTRASDDISGVVGYGLWITTGSPGMPAPEIDIGNVTSYTTEQLAPGTYNFCIRAVDRSGRWSDNYASYGPVTIREAEPSDLTYYQPALWDYPLVPSTTQDATVTEAYVSPTLPGNATATYWSIFGRNAGESATSSGFRGALHIDDEYQTFVFWGSVGAGGGFYGPNRGPISVRGGRHTLAFHYDSDEEIYESDEFNNVWGHQFIWTPWTVTPNTYTSIGAHADAEDGWEDIVDGSPIWYNCDGAHVNASGWWNAVYVWPEDDTDDYDVRIHEPSTGSEEGFGLSVASSYRSVGLLDAVIINSNMAGFNEYDVGMLNRWGGDSSYHMGHITNSWHEFGDSLTYTMNADMMLKAHEFELPEAGFVSIVLDVDPADGPLTLLWYDSTFTTGGLTAYSAMDMTDTYGRARIDVEITETGYNGIVVYRNPPDGRAALDYTLEIQTTPPDFACYYAPGWHAPLVPRPADDGTPGAVAQPDTLYGNIDSSYMNLAVRNDSPTGTAGLHARFFVDGVYTLSLGYPAFGPYVNSLFNYGSPLNVRGGRHIFSVHLDPLEAYEEIYEDNNIYGEQYLWGPLAVSTSTPVTRGAPPEMMGGWDHLSTGAFWYNCDGLRTGVNGYWAGMAIMPINPGDDHNVRVHDKMFGTKDGFTYNHATSSWGAGQSDFVLVNYNFITSGEKDYGVLHQTGTGGYVAQAVGSTYHPTPFNGATYGPYTIGEEEILRLHEFTLSPGFYVVHVENESGAVDWGLSVYGADTTYLAKSHTLYDGAAWQNGPGGIESIAFEVVDGGYHCIAVWKTTSGDLYDTGAYKLRFWDSLTPVEDPPAVSQLTRLTSIKPNPFNPRTTIDYQLARASDVQLGIYNVQGALVRTLVLKSQPAGPQSAVWDGADDRGQRVASDVYLVRLRADGIDEMRKIVLLK